jgi:hypothetical protein
MSDNVINFPVPEKKCDLGSPKIKELIKEIFDLRQSKGLIILELDSDDNFRMALNGDLSLLEMIIMCSHGLHECYLLQKERNGEEAISLFTIEE